MGFTMKYIIIQTFGGGIRNIFCKDKADLDDKLGNMRKDCVLVFEIKEIKIKTQAALVTDDGVSQEDYREQNPMEKLNE